MLDLIPLYCCHILICFLYLINGVIYSMENRLLSYSEPHTTELSILFLEMTKHCSSITVSSTTFLTDHVSVGLPEPTREQGRQHGDALDLVRSSLNKFT